jgi:hypothetical protein
MMHLAPLLGFGIVTFTLGEDVLVVVLFVWGPGGAHRHLTTHTHAHINLLAVAFA